MNQSDHPPSGSPPSGPAPSSSAPSGSASSGSSSPNAGPRRYRAGEAIEDLCRACQADRIHTVMAAGSDGRPLRVVCGFCGSEHNYRGGPRTNVTASADPRSARVTLQGRPSNAPPRPPDAGTRGAVSDPPLPLVSDRERAAPPVTLDASALVAPSRSEASDASGASVSESSPSDPSSDTTSSDQAMDLELLLRRIIREESGLTPVVPAEKWRGGDLVLKPGKPGIQEKTWPIDTFFHKIVMIRNRLRTLEQQLNASDLPDDVKVRLQGYVTGCYGTLTSFNVLFADEDDHFKGASTD